MKLTSLKDRLTAILYSIFESSCLRVFLAKPKLASHPLSRYAQKYNFRKKNCEWLEHYVLLAQQPFTFKNRGDSRKYKLKQIGLEKIVFTTLWDSKSQTITTVVIHLHYFAISPPFFPQK